MCPVLHPPGSCSIQSFLSNPRRPGKGSGSRSTQRGLPQGPPGLCPANLPSLPLPSTHVLELCGGGSSQSSRNEGKSRGPRRPTDAQPSPQPLQLSLSSFIHQILFKHLLCARLCHEGHRGYGPHHGDPSFHTLSLDRRPGGGPPNLDPLSLPRLRSRQDFLGLKFPTRP